MTSIEKIEKKIISSLEIENSISEYKSKKKKIVFTNGCFDILHKGHLDYLSRAKDNGDVLIVGLNSDKSIRNIKGPKRPIQPENDRAYHLAALQFVDAVILFDEDTPFDLIKKIHPDILIKGGDYSIKTIIGSDLVQEGGGVVKTIPFLEGYSTTNIINKIIKIGND